MGFLFEFYLNYISNIFCSCLVDNSFVLDLLGCIILQPMGKRRAILQSSYILQVSESILIMT